MPDDDLDKRFGSLVRRLRRAEGYSQEGFALRAGLHPTYLNSVEQGNRNISIRTADQIAKALGTTLSKLFSELEQGLKGSDGG